MSLRSEDDVAREVLDKLDARVRPLLQAHGGDLTLVGVSQGVVRVRFEGACVGCPLQPVTIVATIEPALRAVRGVEGVDVAGAQAGPGLRRRLRAALQGFMAEPRR